MRELCVTIMYRDTVATQWPFDNKTHNVNKKGAPGMTQKHTAAWSVVINVSGRIKTQPGIVMWPNES